MDTPLYDELVVKYYLSKGIKPFSYPHEPVANTGKPKITVADIRSHGPRATVGGYIDLMTKLTKVAEEVRESGVPVVVAEQRPKYNYFRL